MKNNNQAIVKKLTSRLLRANKKRNFFIFTAILLTTFMIMSVLSIGMSYDKSMKAHHTRLMGTTAHMRINNLSEKGVDLLKTLDFISCLGVSIEAAVLEDTFTTDDKPFILSYCDETLWNELLLPAYIDFVGAYPQNENEVMIPRWILKKMGIENPKIGMNIPLSYVTADGLHEDTFTLSGFYTSYGFSYANGATIIPVSEAFLRKPGIDFNLEMVASIQFRDNGNFMQNNDNISEALTGDPSLLTGNLDFSQMAVAGSNENMAGMIIAYALVVLFLMLTGFLLIYNVLYISVSNYVRFYGLLKTVGTTPKQLRRIVVGQVTRLCIIAIPLGAALAALMSLVIVPFALTIYDAKTEISFSPYIFLGTALFSFVTALIGAAVPAKKTSRITPVEAMRHTGEKSKKNRVLIYGGGKPYRMATRNIFRNKKRVAVMLLSLFLGMTTFMSVAILAFSQDPAKSAYSNFGDSDFILAYHPNGINFLEDVHKFDNDYLRKLESLPGFAGMRTSVRTTGLMKYTDDFETYARGLFMGKDDIDSELKSERFRQNFKCVVLAIDSVEITDINSDLAEPLDMEAFERGEFALIATDTPELLDEIKIVEITFPDSIKPMTVSIAGVRGYYKIADRRAAPTIIISKTFLNQYVENPVIFAIDIRVEEKYQEEALAAIQELIDGDEELSLHSQIEERESVNSSKTLFWILGGTLAGILGMIGILNFINVILAGIMTRKREIAALESVGMTRRQTSRMLIYEGVGYAVITLLLAFSLGNFISLYIFKIFERQATDMYTFSYPYILFTVISIVIILFCAITPKIAYRSMCKATIVERLREAE